MPSHEEQKIKLKFSIESFQKNLEFMRYQSLENIKKVLKTGASAYATSAAKHTPPFRKKGEKAVTDIEPIFYEDGVLVRNRVQMDMPPHGRRRIYCLTDLAKDPNVKFRSYYGRMARQGYWYMVKIHREGKRPVRKFCRDLTEARACAHEDYRGLYRAAWALQFKPMLGRLPSAFQKYIEKRPALSKMAHLNEVRMDEVKHEVTIINHAIPSGESFLASTDTNANIAAVKSMEDRMNKFFKKKYEL